MPSLTVKFAIAGDEVEAEIEAPTGPTSARQMLPFFRAVAEAIVDRGVRHVVAEGKAVSCRAGCGACCRQLVPIAPPEAHVIADLVEEMPEPRRATIRERFAAARARLGETPLLAMLEDPGTFADGDLQRLGLDYFALGIACPFLEDESCSIYPERPIACREYLVTSPAEDCARPSAESISMVPMPGQASSAVSRLDEAPGERFIPWVPLILAPSWSRSNPEDPPKLMAPELLRRFFSRLAEPAQPA
jgi:Fe-S-cluster containining protein